MGQFLRQNPGIGGIDEITDAEALFLQNIAGLTYTAGDILYHDGSDLVNLGIGTALQLLRTNAGTNAPEWATISGTTDEKVGVDSGATAGYLGAASNDGVLRTDATLGYVDGGDFVTLNVNIGIDDLTDVTLGTPVPDDFLKYNGAAWVNIAGEATGGAKGSSFYMDDGIILPVDSENAIEVNTLSKIPIGTAEEVDVISCANNTVLGEAYLYDVALGGVVISAGTWVFSTYASVSSKIGGRVSSISRNIYHVDVEGTETMTITGSGTSRTATASGGTPFVAGDAAAAEIDAGFLQTPKGLYQITGFTNSTTVTIATPVGYGNESTVAFNVWKLQFSSSTGTVTAITTSYTLYSHEIVFTEISITAADKLGEIIFGISNNTTDVNFTHNGTEHYSHFHSPLVTRHNDLPGLNGGTSAEYYHLTSAQHTIATQVADTTNSGYLSTVDWDVFNDKQVALSGATLTTATVATGDKVLIQDIDDSNNLKTVTAQSIADLGGGGGDVSKVGTPADSQIGVWTGDGTIEGTSGLTYDGSNFQLTGDIGSTGTKITKGWFTDLMSTNAIVASITGSAPTLTTTRAIYGNNFNGSAALTQIIASTYGGTGNGFTKFTGPTTAERTFTLPNANATLLYSGGDAGTPSALVGTNISGTASGLTAGAVSTITGLAPDTATTQATQPNITSLGTLTSLQVDNLNFNLNTISSTAGTDLLITPLAGQQLILDGLIVIDNGVLTGATSITSTGFTGALTGNASTVTGFTPASGSLTLAGADALTLTTTAGTNVTLPTTGTLSAIAGTETLTNKRITSRVTTEASSATPTINTDNSDAHSITALALAVTSMTTNLSGTPTNFQKLIIRILDNATGRAITWGAKFEDRGVALPTTTTSSKLLTVGFIYDTVDAIWGCVAVSDET